MIDRRRKVPAYRGAITVSLIAISVTVVLPLVYMLLTSMRTMKDYLRSPLELPVRIAFENYHSLYTGYPILSGLMNSFLISTISLVVSLVVAVPAAFAFAKVRAGWLKPLYLFVTTLMMIPIMVTILPRYILFSRMGIIDTRIALIFSYVGTTLPYTVYLLASGFRSIPDALLEAAKIDGAGYIPIIFHVVVPLGMPSLIAVSILDFISFWNELLQALMFINTLSLKPITAIVSTLGGRFVSNMPLMMAGLLLATVPIIIIYTVFQRHIVAGVTMGAVK